ncbi:glycosyltransferase family 4 protein [Agromyces protaetiae]|uniref:glycosyltransferase family 4 protein n=1 Tax=Agromyces protaetiae TaxID=2509455 RepID=UPI0013ED3329|nr:glycosyltransferase family 4 protein [Agromyces protaetiae]
MLHFLVPDGFDEPARASGGNVYDRRVAAALQAAGFDVRLAPLDVGARDRLDRALVAVPDDGLVLVDGLVAVAASEVLSAHASRLRVVVLAHMVASALAESSDASATAGDERTALSAARRIIATSDWTRSELAARGLAEFDRIAVARPGVDVSAARIARIRAAPVRPEPARDQRRAARFLCVGALARHKGQDVLVEALAGLTDVPPWTCSIVGSHTADPSFAGRIVSDISAAGLEGVTLAGVLTGSRLDDAFGSADLVIAPSRAESYGMVVADALARGIPVVTTRVGGIPEAVAGHTSAVLVAPDDPTALRAVLKRWLADVPWRDRLTAAALRSPTPARYWSETTRVVAGVLTSVRAESGIGAAEVRSTG